MVYELGIDDIYAVEKAIVVTSTSLLEELHTVNGIGMNETAYAIVVQAGQMAYAAAYKYVYYCQHCLWQRQHHCVCILGRYQQVHGRPRCCGHVKDTSVTRNKS